MPLLLDRNEGQQGRLVGHFARANPQWNLADGNSVLVIFSGPHGYISLSWYEGNKIVPTWNYTAVHASGVFRIDDDRTRLLDIVGRYVNHYESDREQPWSLDSQPADFIDQLLDSIVGFEIPIETIEGKFKLSQNHDDERRQRVIEQLRRDASDNAQALASLMENS